MKLGVLICMSSMTFAKSAVIIPNFYISIVAVGRAVILVSKFFEFVQKECIDKSVSPLVFIQRVRFDMLYIIALCFALF